MVVITIEEQCRLEEIGSDVDGSGMSGSVDRRLTDRSRRRH